MVITIDALIDHRHCSNRLVEAFGQARALPQPNFVSIRSGIIGKRSAMTGVVVAESSRSRQFCVGQSW